MRTGIANLPLHTGQCPGWLFPRMRRLAGCISELIIDEFGTEEFLKRISDPYFFQALGCTIGFDFHSSGLTTTTLGALKEAANKQNLGIKVAGGKGKTSRKTIEEIGSTGFNLSTSKIEKLKYSSRMSAKVDNALVQDSYQLYHHSFMFDERGNWAVVQQGMNLGSRYARRYHWLSNNIADFVEEPHNAICCDSINSQTMDLTSKQNNEIRKISVDLVSDDIIHLKKYFNAKINQKAIQIQKTINDFNQNIPKTKIMTMMPRHTIIEMDKRNYNSLERAHELQPGNFEELVSAKGIGAKAIRSLALISELAYGAEISWKDPVKYSFAHGGKDGIPYPVDRKLMDSNAELLKNAIKDAKLGDKEKLNAIKRLSRLY